MSLEENYVQFDCYSSLTNNHVMSCPAQLNLSFLTIEVFVISFNCSQGVGIQCLVLCIV